MSKKESTKWFVAWLVIAFLMIVCILQSGCGTVNGIGADAENAGRWLREVTQKGVDNMELRKIRSAIDNQNRIINRGTALANATK